MSVIKSLTVSGTTYETPYPVVEDKVLTSSKAISANSYGNGSVSIAKSGYTPIGIVGMHVENASGGSYNTYCSIHSFYLDGTTAYYIVRNNHASSTATIKITASVMYVPE